MDFFAQLYYCKKVMLMAENLNNGFEKVDEIYEELKARLLSIDSIECLMLLAEEYFYELKKLVPDETYEDWFYSDYDIYTDKYHHRSYWNEIPNHQSIVDFLEKFLEIFDAQNEPQNFAISLYDFNNYDIIFANEDDLNSFLCNFDIAPYTVFEIKGDTWIEMYSA